MLWNGVGTTLVDSLRQSLARRVSDPACWTQCVAARNQENRGVSPRSTEAQNFCGYGALTRAAEERGLSDRWLIEIFNALVLTQLIRANDEGGHEAVLAFLAQLDKMI